MIRTSHEAVRGCGVRVPGGLYLVSDSLSEPCPLLPLPLDRCPHCGQGIGPARGWTWITPSVLFPATEHGTVEHNALCPLGRPTDARLAEMGVNPETYHRTGERAGLIWVGEKFYPVPELFMDEAARMGVSRRIKTVPRGFELGMWVYLGHRKAIDHSRSATAEELASGFDQDRDMTIIASNVDGMRVVDGPGDRWSPGIITLFRPTTIEYVVKGDETDEEIEKLEKRGIQPVRVINDVEEVSA